MICSNCLRRQSRRHRSRRRRPARARRARRASAACASPSRRWPGAATSTTTAMPGRRCGARTIRPSGWCSTPSISSRARRISSAIRAIPRDRIFLVQIADAPLLQMDYLSWSRHFRNFPGQGDLPLLDFMEALAATGYDGPLSLEIFNDQFRAGSARSVAVDGHRSLLFPARPAGRRSRHGRFQRSPRCRRARWHRAPSSSSSPSTRPARPSSKRMLAAPGLSPRRPAQVEGGDALAPGRHQPGGQPREGGLCPLLQHHCTARRCARSASKVDDAAATFERAKLLARCSRSASRSGPGELDIPAVRGVGGSLVYFLDPTSELGRVWDIEFDDTGRDAAECCRADARRPHLAVDALRGDADLAAVLHLAARPREDPAAGRRRPGGLVQEPGDRVRRRQPCASCSTPRRASARSPRAFSRRSSVPACSTSLSPPTIFWRPWRACSRTASQLLPIPENYYDDLEAKTDLAPELHRRVQGAQHPLRPRGRRRVSAGLHAKPSSSASSSRSSQRRRYCRLWRRQRAGPARRAGEATCGLTTGHG